jgi:hypothetical protein
MHCLWLSTLMLNCMSRMITVLRSPSASSNATSPWSVRRQASEVKTRLRILRTCMYNTMTSNVVVFS